MGDDSKVRLVLAKYPQIGATRRIHAQGGGGGWSGSRLWRVEDERGSYCLRRWPQGHPSRERLEFNHGVLRRVAAGGMMIVPAPLATPGGQTFVEQDEFFWELAPWLPGVADFHSNPSLERLRSAMRSLAEFHEFAARSARQDVGPAPCLIDRDTQLNALRKGGFDEIVAAVNQGLDRELDSRARQIVELTRGRLAGLQPVVREALARPWPLSPAIRDIHHDHVLFTGNEVSGIVDFGAMRTDSPLTDVARLVGSLVGNDPADWAAALDAYAERRSLSAADRELIGLLDATGLVLGALNWLTWLYVEGREMGELAPIIRRLDEMLVRLQDWKSIAGIRIGPG